MSVTIHWITPDAQSVIVEAARVSSDPNANKKPDADLLRYLIRHKHWSPFEMSNMSVRIETTRDIGRQLLRHRSFHFQEFSQRYSDVSMLGDPVFREARMQHPTNRQASVECKDSVIPEEWADYQADVWGFCRQAYRFALDQGIAKEVARAVLPEGLTPSALYMNGTIRSWIHFCDVRSIEAGAQKEIAEIADGVKALLREHLPDVMEAVDAT